jgi:hypothetical protein
VIAIAAGERLPFDGAVLRQILGGDHAAARGHVLRNPARNGARVEDWPPSFASVRSVSA